MRVLVTGGAGFFGGVLKRRLLAEGHACTSFDVLPDPDEGLPGLTAVRGDVRDRAALEALGRFDAVFHCAAVLAHGSRRGLLSTNVEGTRNVAEAARRGGGPPLVFLSSNCLWARNYDRPVAEDEPPRPGEAYGKSKAAAEAILDGFAGDLPVAVLRVPTILDEGRLGLLAILFEFIDEGRRVWTVGRGANRYQWLYAGDLAEACLKAAAHGRSDTFHLGADDVGTLAEVLGSVLRRADTGARLAHLPRRPAELALRAAHALRLSPLGPYQARMISRSFVFDTSRAKRVLGWRPTLTNEEMLWRAYRYWRDHREELRARTGASAHRRGAPLGALRLVKWLS